MLLTILLYDALGEFSTQNQDMNLHTHFGQLLTDTGCTLGETSKVWLVTMSNERIVFE